MTTRIREVLVVGLVLAAGLSGSCRGLAAPPDRVHQPPAAQADRLHRAGRPEVVAWYAIPSVNRHYSAGYVGGGAVLRGEPRCPDEGTWGLDYSGILFPKQIWLRWWRGRHDQDGGSYTTDGPRLRHE